MAANERIKVEKKNIHFLQIIITVDILIYVVSYLEGEKQLLCFRLFVVVVVVFFLFFFLFVFFVCFFFCCCCCCCCYYEGESISNQPNLFSVEIHLFFFEVIAL